MVKKIAEVHKVVAYHHFGTLIWSTAKTSDISGKLFRQRAVVTTLVFLCIHKLIITTTKN